MDANRDLGDAVSEESLVDDMTNEDNSNVDLSNYVSKERATELFRKGMEKGKRSNSRDNGFDIEELKEQLREDNKIILDQEIKRREEQLLRKQNEEQLRRREQEADYVAKNFLGKISEDFNKYEDFEEVTDYLFKPKEDDKGIGAFPGVIAALHDREDATAIFYELSKNPTKLREINELFYDSKGAAKKKVDMISSRIKKNKDDAGRYSKSSPEPSVRIKSTSSSLGASYENASVTDFRNEDFTRP